MIQNLGTGNGMAKSLLDSHGEPCEASNATLFIIRGKLYSLLICCQFIRFFLETNICSCLLAGHKRSLDIATISQGETRFFSMLMLAWGM